MTASGAKIGIALGLEEVAFGYDGVEFLFDMAVAPAQITAIAGPSGSGKSTLLNLVAGFERPWRGTIWAGGRDITAFAPDRRPVSMLFQENNLFGHLSVEENVLLGVAPNLRASHAQRQAACAALDRTGLKGKEKRLPSQLSGGERQRVALARALIRRRPILLLDEPFASLGPALRHQMLDLVRSLHRETGMTILFVTHHPDDIVGFAASYVFLSGGTIAARGPAHEMNARDAPDAVKAYLKADGNTR